VFNFKIMNFKYKVAYILPSYCFHTKCFDADRPSWLAHYKRNACYVSVYFRAADRQSKT
jgi:hypothetical protein